MLKYLFLSLFISMNAALSAQTHLIIKRINQSVASFPLTAIRNLKFGNTSMVVNFYSGSSQEFTISEISEYYFGNASSGGELLSGADFSARIVPNPVSEWFEVHCNSLKEENLSIELLDATGRVVKPVFLGKHLGRKEYRQSLNLPPGLYFCLLQTGEKTISRPFIVQ